MLSMPVASLMAWESDQFSPLESMCELLKLTFGNFVLVAQLPELAYPHSSTSLGSALQHLFHGVSAKLSLSYPTNEPSCSIATFRLDLGGPTAL